MAITRINRNSQKYIFAVTPAGDYAGLIDVASLHYPDLTEMVPHLLAADLAVGRDQFLLPGNDIRVGMAV